MNGMTPIEGHEGIMRDNKSGAIINISNEGAQHSANRVRMAEDAARLNQVERDVSDIKMMLKQLIER
jgi:hypothetical protein|tara:strand:- start:6965 stop:7165 length:201 start_codon:yes stop_codon:yes gene_type:complete